MLTGDEKVWKEVQESLKKIEELKAQWSILFPVGWVVLLGLLPCGWEPDVDEAKAGVCLLRGLYPVPWSRNSRSVSSGLFICKR